MKFIKKNRNENFVIIIDNLDRIGTKGAIKIWATMKTFFDFDMTKCKTWREKLWLLVPFDFTGLVSLWNYKPDRTNEKQEIDEEEKGDDNQEVVDIPNDDLSIAKSFIEKTFQIRFETPIPVLSDWEAYLKKCFKVAFENYEDSGDIQKVYHIFGIFNAPNENRSPTPREVKLFINNLVITYRQFKDEVPLYIQALYILLRKNIWLNEKRIIPDLLSKEQKFIKPLKNDFLDKDYPECLAALYFNVNKDRAAQLLLEEPVNLALMNVDVDELNKLKIYSGFTNICEIVISKTYEELSKQVPNSLAKICKSLSIISLSDDNINESWEHLKKGMLLVKSWKNLDDISSNGISELVLKFKHDEKFLKDILDTLAKSFPLFQVIESVGDKSVTKIKKRDQVIINLKSLSLILDTFKSLGKDNIIKSNFSINCTPGIYNFLLLYASQIPELTENFIYFIPKFDINECIENLSTLVGNGNFENPQWIEVIEIYLNFDINIKSV